VVNVALPVIRQDFGYLQVSVADLQWIVNSYALTYAAFLLTAGKLGDLFGRRLMFLIGLVLFTAASVGCGAAGDINALIALRALQGLGAALLTPAGLSILTATFAPEERGLAIGLWSAVLGVGVALGPLVGGVLVQAASWRWVFIINVPIGIICFIATLLWVEESRDTTQKRRLDLPGVATSSIGLFALTLGLLKGNDYGWADGKTIGLLALGVGALGAFVLVEKYQRQPMLPLSLFRSATFTGANVVAVFAGFVLFGQLFFGSLLMQTVMGYSALKTGLSLLPLTLLIMFVSPPVGRLLSKGVGPRWLITAGMLLLANSLVLMSRLGFGSGFLDLLPAFVLAGIGFALVLTPLTAAALAGVPVRHAGIGSGVINTTRQAGGTLGLAVMVSVSTAVINSWLTGGRSRPDGFVHSVDVVMLVAAGVSVVGALVAVLTLAREAPAALPAVPQQDQLQLQPTGAWAISAPSVLKPLPAFPAASRIHLQVVGGPATGHRIGLPARPLVFGRAATGIGSLEGDPELSREHARLSPLRDGRAALEDLRSSNGTFLNGSPIDGPVLVSDGDSIRIGQSELRVVGGAVAPREPSAAVANPRLHEAMTRMSLVAPTAGTETEGALVAQVEAGPAAGTRIPIGDELIIGRAEREPGRLGGDPEISRRHASLSTLDDSRVLVEDLASTNGTLVNGHRIYAPTVARQGDEIRVGTTVLRLAAPTRAATAGRVGATAGTAGRER
jgi:EmrB/QacA subfamily drug resistance transporter